MSHMAWAPGSTLLEHPRENVHYLLEGDSNEAISIHYGNTLLVKKNLNDYEVVTLCTNILQAHCSSFRPLIG